MRRRIAAFFESRLPLSDVVNHLKKPLPKHINWLFSLGSMAVFLLILQAVTGAFLALYYSSSPDHAYNSVNYISHEVPFGAFVRGLHHWGSSALVIVVFLHLLRVVLYGSYKAPRELTWIVGVILFLVVLGFGFTGYLLPWDQKAYWATVVGVEIAGTVPLIGDFIAKILRGGAEVGAVTLTRFYTLHTIWLPWLVFVLVGLHLFFVRYYGSAGLPENKPEEMQSGKPFYPDQLFEDAVAILVLFILLAAAAIFIPVPLEELANPTDASYDPRPEWYFLFLFQLLRYFEGPLEVIGTFLIPTVAIVLLLSCPFWISASEYPCENDRLHLLSPAYPCLPLSHSPSSAGVLQNWKPHRNPQLSNLNPRPTAQIRARMRLPRKMQTTPQYSISIDALPSHNSQSLLSFIL